MSVSPAELAESNSRVPRKLDEVITLNRDLVRLYLATDEQIAGLGRIIPRVPQEHLRGALSDWRLVAYEFCAPEESPEIHIHLLGNNFFRGIGAKITSPVLAIDLGTKQVVTTSGSIYKLAGDQGEGEPALDQILLLCGALWAWGRGQDLGVFHVYC